MNEIEIVVNGKIFRLTNNSNKYALAKADAGPNATPKQVLAHYDKRGGYIQDKDGNKINNDPFWQQEKMDIETQQQQRNRMKSIANITAHPVIASFIVIVLLAMLWYFFDIDLSRFSTN